MPFWIELRCGIRKGTKNRVCYSDSNSGPMDLAGDSLEAIKAACGEQAIEARAKGWRKRNGVWTCPNCQ